MNEKLVEITSKDGTKVKCKIILEHTFDNKKYVVLLPSNLDPDEAEDKDATVMYRDPSGALKRISDPMEYSNIVESFRAIYGDAE